MKAAVVVANEDVQYQEIEEPQPLYSAKLFSFNTELSQGVPS